MSVQYLRRGDGYLMTKASGHPMAGKTGWAFDHRLVAFGKHGPGGQVCHWCGVSINWSGLHVDHLNEVKDDNRADNLVLACSSCNRARGAMIPFIAKLLPERMEELLSTFPLMKASRAA